MALLAGLRAGAFAAAAFPDIEQLALTVSPLVDGFVAINSYGPVLDFDPETADPLLGSDEGQGWLSGPGGAPTAT